MAVTLHQLRCFVSTLEHGSFTGAAAQLGLSQPSLSEQVRQLEKQIGASLFYRLGRGVAPTDAAYELRAHAVSALASVEAGERAVAGAASAVSGAIRFGLFGAAHLYIADDLINDVLVDHPGLRITLIGQNSRDVIADVAAGRIEAGLVALPIENHEQLQIHPVAKDELVYLTVDPRRAAQPVTAEQLARAELVLSESSWGDDDFSRQQLIRMTQSEGSVIRPRIEVENVETALEVAARGLADTVTARAVYERLRGRLPGVLHAAPLSPSIHDSFAIVFRRGVALSRASKCMIAHATRLIQAVTVSGVGPQGKASV